MATSDSALVVYSAPAVELVEEVTAEEEPAEARTLRNATAPAETKPKTVKAPKEKAVKMPKEKVVKEKAPKAPALHPSYLVMVVEAIGALKGRTGSSQRAIAKYLEDQYKTGLPPNFKKMLTIQLRNLTKSGKLVKVKNSYKLSDELKKPAKAASAPKAAAAAEVAPSKAKVVKKLSPASRVKSKSTGAVGTKAKAGGAKATKADVKTSSKVAKPKAVRKASAPAAKKAKATSSPAKKAAPATEKAEAEVSKKAAPAAAAKKPVAGRKPPTVRKMVTPKKSPKSVKAKATKPAARATPAQPAANANPTPPPQAPSRPFYSYSGYSRRRQIQIAPGVTAEEFLFEETVEMFENV